MNKTYRQQILVIIIYLFAFLIFQHSWFYTWDSLDIIIFTFFMYCVFFSKSMAYFVLLFFVAILNRESALFIALYILIDSFNIKGKLYLVSPRKLIIGIVLIIIGITYTKIIRDILILSQTLVLDANTYELFGNHIHFFNNLKNLFYHNIFSSNIVISSFVLGTLFYFGHSIKYYSDSQIKVAIIYFFIMLNIIVFGIINETRMYFILFPLIIFLEISSIKYSSKSYDLKFEV